MAGLLCWTRDIDVRSHLSIVLFVPCVEPLERALAPARAAIVEDELRFAADPTRRQELEWQPGIEVGKTAPLVYEPGVRDEDVALRARPHPFHLADKGSIAALEVAEIPRARNHASRQADRTAHRG